MAVHFDTASAALKSLHVSGQAWEVVPYALEKEEEEKLAKDYHFLLALLVLLALPLPCA